MDQQTILIGLVMVVMVVDGTDNVSPHWSKVTIMGGGSKKLDNVRIRDGMYVMDIDGVKADTLIGKE